MKNQHDFKDGAQFVPFGVKILGGWGPVAQWFFDGAQWWIQAIRDTRLCQWTTPSFRHFWTQRLGVSLVNSHAKYMHSY